MKEKSSITKKLIFWVLVLVFLTVSVNAEELTDHTFKSVHIRDALQIIAARYGVTIIPDPALTGLVNGTIHGDDTVETAIRTIIEPLEYSFTKVENYFLVSGPVSPLTLFAETESTMVPVGFISQDFRDQCSEYSQYLTFDEKSGAVFIKAPTSMMPKILTAIRKATNIAGPISILYNLEIVDLGNASDLDLLFSGSYDSSQPQADGDNWMLAPGELGVDGQLSALIHAKITSGNYSFIRKPWLITLPGKTVEFSESLRYVGNNDSKADECFSLKITPTQVDGASGRVLSEVDLSRNGDHLSRVLSSIRTNPGAYELLGVVRQTELTPSQTLFGKEKAENHRDFAVLIAATPVNVEQVLAAPSGLIPIASLESGLISSDPEPVMIPSKPELEVGFAISEKKPVDPWFNFNIPLNSQSKLEADYRSPILYYLRFSREFEPSGGTYLDILAGQGIGPGDQTALMLGLGDKVHLNPSITLFGKYYPNPYFVETKQYYGRSMWSAGASLESGKLGLTVSASGSPDLNGWRVKMDLTGAKTSWTMEINTVGNAPVLYAGLGIKF